MSEKVKGVVLTGNNRGVFKRFTAQWDLQILIIPALIHILIFSYIPMYGILMAFQEFKIGDFPGFSSWVGLKHFSDMLKDPNMPRVLRNTLAMSGLKLLINFPLPIVFAVFINEIRAKFVQRGMQTISYLPHFISWVVAARLMFDFFSSEGGAVNELLVNLNLVKSSVAFFGKSDYFWVMAVVTDLWKELGWNSIIFFAAIASIDIEMYEAADIDGATRLQKMWYITIATIRPTIVILLIFSVGGLLNANFDQAMMLTNRMTNPMLIETADVLNTYVYRMGLGSMRYSFASAVGLFQAVFNFLLLLSVNKLADKLGETSLV